MWRRLGPTDFKRTGASKNNPEAASLWHVCEEYEIRGKEIRAKWPFEQYLYWGSYSPLVDAPELFLELAALHEESDFSEAALAFIHRYGLPGSSGLFGSNESPNEGLQTMALTDLRQEVEQIWLILRIYEAALNRDEEAIKALLEEDVAERYRRVREVGLEFAKAMKWTDLSPIETFTERHAQSSADETDRFLGSSTGEATFETSLIPVVLCIAAYDVNWVVQKRCRPILFLQTSLYYADTATTGLRHTWASDNLIGAAYLQMYWLMTSGEDIARCEYCRRIMSLARTHPDGRKRRRDKRFCSDSCRQAHHRSKKRS